MQINSNLAIRSILIGIQLIGNPFQDLRLWDTGFAPTNDNGFASKRHSSDYWSVNAFWWEWIPQLWRFAKGTLPAERCKPLGILAFLHPYKQSNGIWWIGTRCLLYGHTIQYNIWWTDPVTLPRPARELCVIPPSGLPTLESNTPKTYIRWVQSHPSMSPSRLRILIFRYLFEGAKKITE